MVQVVVKDTKENGYLNTIMMYKFSSLWGRLQNSRVSKPGQARTILILGVASCIWHRLLHLFTMKDLYQMY